MTATKREIGARAAVTCAVPRRQSGVLHGLPSRGGSTALLAFLVKSEQEKKKKSKSELASFEKLSSTTTAKVRN